MRRLLPTMRTLTTLTTAGSTVYYLLLTDNFLNTSIASIILFIHDLDIAPHAFVIGLLPIYIALTIFGSVLLGIYSSKLLHYLARRLAKYPFFQRLGCREQIEEKKWW